LILIVENLKKKKIEKNYPSKFDVSMYARPSSCAELRIITSAGSCSSFSR